VPQLQRDLGVVMFFPAHRGHPVASSALMGRITHAFGQAIERFAREQGVPLHLIASKQPWTNSPMKPNSRRKLDASAPDWINAAPPGTGG
jgi:hypothetical protein